MWLDPSGPPLVAPGSSPLRDAHGRRVTYLRLSVTDRCDLRCTYCMPARMTFLPKSEVLSIEEMVRLADLLIGHGVNRIRLTGGEPLVRRDVMTLCAALGERLGHGLDELTISTNGTRLARHAADLARIGVRRVNVSLDTLDAERYRAITRGGVLADVLSGIRAASDAGLKVKLNAVASGADVFAEAERLIAFAHGHGHALTFIEEMPLGETGHDRRATFLPLKALMEDIASRHKMLPVRSETGGPARMFELQDTGGTLGFITPLGCSFCASCNRVRISAAGTLFPCMGDEGHVDLKPSLRSSACDEPVLDQIRAALAAKPEGHRFAIGDEVSGISRTMNALGG